MDRRIKLSDPRRGRLSSNRDEQRIPLLRYEDDLVPRRRPAIWIFQKERTAIEICRKREHPHTWYSLHDPLRIPQPSSKTRLKEAIHPSGSGGNNLPGPRERSLQGGPSASCFPNNGRIMGKTG